MPCRQLFIELTKYHDETLYVLVKKYASPGDILLCSSKLAESPLVRDLDKLTLKMPRFWEYVGMLRRERVQVVYFNTIETPRAIAYYIIAFVFRIRLVCLLHNVDCFYKLNANQTVRKRFFRHVGGRFVNVTADNQLVLSRRIQSHLRQRNIDTEHLESTPLREFALRYANSHLPPLDPKARYAGAVGAIDFARRRYDPILDIDETILRAHNLRFLVIGDSTRANGPEFRAKVETLGRRNDFFFFDRYVRYEQLFACILRCDFLFALTAGGGYGQYKTAAVLSFGEALQKPVIFGHEEFELCDVDGQSVFASRDISEVVERAIALGDQHRSLGLSDRRQT